MCERVSGLRGRQPEAPPPRLVALEVDRHPCSAICGERKRVGASQCTHPRGGEITSCVGGMSSCGPPPGNRVGRPCRRPLMVPVPPAAVTTPQVDSGAHGPRMTGRSVVVALSLVSFCDVIASPSLISQSRPGVCRRLGALGVSPGHRICCTHMHSFVGALGVSPGHRICCMYMHSFVGALGVSPGHHICCTHMHSHVCFLSRRGRRCTSLITDDDDGSHVPLILLVLSLSDGRRVVMVEDRFFRRCSRRVSSCNTLMFWNTNMHSCRGSGVGVFPVMRLGLVSHGPLPPRHLRKASSVCMVLTGALPVIANIGGVQAGVVFGANCILTPGVRVAGS